MTFLEWQLYGTGPPQVGEEKSSWLETGDCWITSSLPPWAEKSACVSHFFMIFIHLPCSMGKKRNIKVNSRKRIQSLLLPAQWQPPKPAFCLEKCWEATWYMQLIHSLALIIKAIYGINFYEQFCTILQRISGSIILKWQPKRIAFLWWNLSWMFFILNTGAESTLEDSNRTCSNGDIL